MVQEHNKTQNNLFQGIFGEDNLTSQKKFLSIILSSKNTERLVPLLDHLRDSCYDPQNFECCVAIDDNQKQEEDLKSLSDKYPFLIRYIVTDHGYFKANSSYNELIFNGSDRNTYFVSCISDRYRFSCKNWDLLIREYIGIVPDDMFFLRMAKYSKNLKVRKNLYEAFSFNENWGIYSRKLLEVADGFPEWLCAHDCGFEMLNLFVSKNKKDKFRRDIVAPNMLSTDAIVSSTAHGLENFYVRSLKGYLAVRRSFFSKEYAQYLKRSAVKIYLNHLIWQQKIDGIVKCDESDLVCFIENKMGKRIKKTSYHVSQIYSIFQTMISRYRSIHLEMFVISFYPLLRKKWGYEFVLKLIRSKRFHRRVMLNFLRLLFGCGKTNFSSELQSQEMRNVIWSNEFKELYDKGFGASYWREFKK